jgi:ABC-type molybdate transport system substrate-binding protein
MKRLSSAIFVITLVFGAWVNARAQGEITLLAVGPMRAPTEKVVADFQAKSGYKVKVTYANGMDTRKMVAKGQPLDVSLVIAPFPGAIASGSVIPASATTIVSILTGVAVPKGAPHPDISSPAAVKKALLAAKSIGYEDPDFTVAGEGVVEALNKLGIADQVASKSLVELGPGAQGLSPDAAVGSHQDQQAPRNRTSRNRLAHAQRHGARQRQVRHRRRSAPEDLYPHRRCGVHLHPCERPPRQPKPFCNTWPRPTPRRSSKTPATSHIANPPRVKSSPSRCG